MPTTGSDPTGSDAGDRGPYDGRRISKAEWDFWVILSRNKPARAHQLCARSREVCPARIRKLGAQKEKYLLLDLSLNHQIHGRATGRTLSTSDP